MVLAELSDFNVEYLRHTHFGRTTMINGSSSRNGESRMIASPKLAQTCPLVRAPNSSRGAPTQQATGGRNARLLRDPCLPQVRLNPTLSPDKPNARQSAISLVPQCLPLRYCMHVSRSKTSVSPYRHPHTPQFSPAIVSNSPVDGGYRSAGEIMINPDSQVHNEIDSCAFSPSTAVP